MMAGKTFAEIFSLRERVICFQSRICASVSILLVRAKYSPLLAWPRPYSKVASWNIEYSTAVRK